LVVILTLRRSQPLGEQGEQWREFVEHKAGRRPLTGVYRDEGLGWWQLGGGVEKRYTSLRLTGAGKDAGAPRDAVPR
jgi:hypothetical protein